MASRAGVLSSDFLEPLFPSNGLDSLKVVPKLDAVRHRGLKLFQIYERINLAASPGYDKQRFEQLLPLLKGRDVQLALLISGGSPSDASLDEQAVRLLREMADKLRDKLAPAVVLLGSPSKDGKKAMLVCSVSKALTDRFRAGDIVKAAASIVGGNGGGRPDFAQAGGPDPSKLNEAVSKVYELVGAG